MAPSDGAKNDIKEGPYGINDRTVHHLLEGDINVFSNI